MRVHVYVEITPEALRLMYRILITVILFAAGLSHLLPSVLAV